MVEAAFLGLSARHACLIPPISRSLIAWASAWIPYLAALVLLRPVRDRRLSFAVILGGAALLRVVLFFFPMGLSDDAFRYLWEGRVLVHGINPYAHSPVDPALAMLRDPSWAGVNHASVPTPYPPVAQFYFALLAFAWGSVRVFRVAASALDIAVAALIFRAATGGADASDRRFALAASAYGWCPLAAMETGLAGHLEPLAALFLLVGLDAARKGKTAAGVFVGLASGVKLMPILAWPLAARRARSAWVAAPAVLLALYLPFSGAGCRCFEGVSAMAREWRGNEAVYGVVHAVVRGAIRVASGEAARTGEVRLPWLDGAVTRLRGTFFDLKKSYAETDLAMPALFSVDDVSQALAKALLFILLLALCIVVALKNPDPVHGGALLMTAAVLCLPVIHPWYLLLFAPLAAAAGSWSWLWLAFSLPFSYLALDGWATRQVWSIPAWVPFFEYVPFVLLLAVEIVVAYNSGIRYFKHAPKR